MYAFEFFKNLLFCVCDDSLSLTVFFQKRFFYNFILKITASGKNGHKPVNLKLPSWTQIERFFKNSNNCFNHVYSSSFMPKS